MSILPLLQAGQYSATMSTCMIQVTRKDGNEANENIVRRFNRKVVQSGVLAIVKAGQRFEKPISKRILVPVRMIWGMEDKFLSRKLAKETIKICPNGQLIFVDDASHWINHEKPEVVNKLILEFLT